MNCRAIPRPMPFELATPLANNGARVLILLALALALTFIMAPLNESYAGSAGSDLNPPGAFVRPVFSFRATVGTDNAAQLRLTGVLTGALTRGGQDFLPIQQPVV